MIGIGTSVKTQIEKSHAIQIMPGLPRIKTLLLDAHAISSELVDNMKTELETKGTRPGKRVNIVTPKSRSRQGQSGKKEGEKEVP